MKTDTQSDELARSLSEFMSLVAHELRTPAAGILAHAWTVNQYWDRLSDRERRNSVESIARRAQRLERLINNLLIFSRFESGVHPDLSLKPFDLGPLIQNVCQDLREEHADHRIELELPSAIPVLADEARTEQVLVNLIENALKFSSAQGSVTVRALVEPAHAEVQVADHGLGIAADDIPRLFRRFSRLRPAAGEERSGTGIGLYLARMLIEAQGGRIWVRSEEGAGSVFSFTLPRPDSEE